jgi:predicted enzyme related to lactoylglutathione lyase
VKIVLLGLRTVVYKVTDLATAKEWWRRHFGITPYFDEPFYVGYDVGGYELGLDPDGEGRKPGPGGSVAYWGVNDLRATLNTLKTNGVRVIRDAEDVGEGILVSSIEDPFGNLVGLIENPHFKLP